MEKQSKNRSSEDIDSILQQYFRYLSSLNIESIERGTPLQHAKWMCLTASDRLIDLERKNRWLGFIQGILFMSNIFTINEMREHVRDGRVIQENEL